MISRDRQQDAERGTDIQLCFALDATRVRFNDMRGNT
jgi:hypothetical protein